MSGVLAIQDIAEHLYQRSTYPWEELFHLPQKRVETEHESVKGRNMES
jgi:hypothetical protein